MICFEFGCNLCSEKKSCKLFSFLKDKVKHAIGTLICQYVRTAEEVSTVIRHAKLEESELKPVTQVLCFPPAGDIQDHYKYVELDDSLLGILQSGDRLVFRGDKDENAVLCTSDQTYEVKEAETSNSMLLVPNLVFPQEVDAVDGERILQKKEVKVVFHKYLELRACKPRLQKLRRLLHESRYCGPEHEQDLLQSGARTFSLQELLLTVQASEQELRAGLEEMFACEIDGAWRVLDHEYHFRIISYILNLVDENSWPFDSVPRRQTISTLSNLVPEGILAQCFDWYTKPTADDQVFQLREDRVCRILAEVLLRAAGKFNLQEFLTAWQESVPEGMKTDLKYLDGIALMDLKSKPEVIWYYAETDLPEDINERFRVLFQTREKWTLDEIRPYIQRLATDKVSVNALLTKYARAWTVNGVKYYSAKHR